MTLRFFCQLEDHRQGRQPRAAAFRLPLPMAHRRERRFDRIRRPDMSPEFGGKVVEREQDVLVLAQTLRRLRILCFIFREEPGVGRQGRFFRRGQIHLVDHLLGVRLNALRQLVQDVGRLMYPTALFSSSGAGFLGYGKNGLGRKIEWT
jgi:hypothetical protein